MTGLVSDAPARPARHLAPAPQQPPVDLLAEAVEAYAAERASTERYRELSLASTFRRRFGAQPEPARWHQRTSLSKSGVYTFRAAGLDWRGGINDDGSEKSIWFCVRDSAGSWHEASTKAQLGRLIDQGFDFVPETAVPA